MIAVLTSEGDDLSVYPVDCEREIAEFGDLWALMYYHFAKEMLDSFGEEGEEALRRAIRSYGRERGLRLRRRHEERGLPINIKTLFEHYDLPGHPDNRRRREVLDEEELLSYILYCPYREIWADHGGDEIGRIYCEEFHHAMWQAYRDDMVVEIPEILTKGDEHCRFIVHIKRE